MVVARVVTAQTAGVVVVAAQWEAQQWSPFTTFCGPGPRSPCCVQVHVTPQGPGLSAHVTVPAPHAQVARWVLRGARLLNAAPLQCCWGCLVSHRRERCGCSLLTPQPAAISSSLVRFGVVGDPYPLLKVACVALCVL